MYVDDTGSLKGLPANPRAAGLAAAAGHAAEIRGDAFVGRTVDCDASFERLDFTLAEVDSSAPWIAEAQAANARRRENSGRMADLLPPGSAVIDASAARGEEAAEDVAQKAVAGKRYTYSQDGDEVVLEVRVPLETKARDVAAKITPDAVSLSVATLPEGERCVIDGLLFQRVKADESCWNLSTVGGERVVQLTLSKQQPTRWLGVLRSG